MNPVLTNVMGVAKALLERDGYLSPVFMLFHDNEMVTNPIPIQFPQGMPAEEAKDKNVFMAGVAAKKTGANYIVLVWDAALRTIPGMTKETTYDPTEAPLLYPKSMRTECIIVQGISVPSGTEEILITCYKGGDGEPVEFLENDFPENFKPESRFAEVVTAGYVTADQIPNIGD